MQIPINWKAVMSLEWLSGGLEQGGSDAGELLNSCSLEAESVIIFISRFHFLFHRKRQGMLTKNC